MKCVKHLILLDLEFILLSRTTQFLWSDVMHFIGDPDSVTSEFMEEHGRD